MMKGYDYQNPATLARKRVRLKVVKPDIQLIGERPREGVWIEVVGFLALWAALGLVAVLVVIKG